MDTSLKPQDGVLFVDDEKVNLYNFEIQFMRYFKVFLADSAHKAIEILRKNDILVVISDQRMPEVSGVELFEKMTSEFPDVIKILLTGYMDVEAIIKAVNKGGIYNYVTKPYEENQMKILIKNAIESVRLKREKNQLLNELQERNQLLEKQNTELDLAKKEAEKNDKLKTAFIANISHEIRTPMNGIIGFSQMLAKPSISAQKRGFYADVVIKSSQQLLHIVNDILDISRIESGNLSLTCDAISVNDLIEDLLSFHYETAINKGIQFNCSKGLPDDKSIIRSDINRLRQIFDNLLSNAFKYTVEGSIKFGYILFDAHLKFFVEDTGIGIPTDMIDEIFKSFRQIKYDLQSEIGGTGLGLAISKKLVNMLGGDLWVESEPGKGSVFYFTVPYNKTAEEKKEPVPSVTEKIENRVTLLIAEDDDINYLYFEEIFNADNFKLIHANNGTQAIDICKKEQIDCVLMDIKMPILDGFEATKQIKKLKPDLPIIAQTGFAMESDKKKAFESGCNDFIDKPIKKDKLFQLLKKHIG